MHNSRAHICRMWGAGGQEVLLHFTPGEAAFYAEIKEDGRAARAGLQARSLALSPCRLWQGPRCSSTCDQPSGASPTSWLRLGMGRSLGTRLTRWSGGWKGGGGGGSKST